jgi:hypothetical protein
MLDPVTASYSAGEQHIQYRSRPRGSDRRATHITGKMQLLHLVVLDDFSRAEYTCSVILMRVFRVDVEWVVKNVLNGYWEVWIVSRLYPQSTVERDLILTV